MWDIATNLDISPGFCQCHTALDIILTATGDLAIISGTKEIQQRFLLYLATPKGERFDPNIGCFAHDYLHEKNTKSNMRMMEQDIIGDMSYQFPEITVNSVSCVQDDSDPFRMQLDVKLANNNTLKFLYTPQELVTLTKELSELSQISY
jgi:phage baseplate assembly protein W